MPTRPPADFEQLWLDELQPQGNVELEAFRQFVEATWAKREAIEAQNELGVDFLDESKQKELDRLLRQERAAERRASTALGRLQRLQSRRPKVRAAPLTDTAFSS